MERSQKQAELAKLDQSLLPKEKFLFGEKGQMLFSDNEDAKSSSRSKSERFMLEKNFTRKPYAQNERKGLKQMPVDEKLRPQVRNHKKRESIVRRHPKTIFDKADLKNKTFSSI